jgi:hypothetical protein
MDLYFGPPDADNFCAFRYKGPVTGNRRCPNHVEFYVKIPDGRGVDWRKARAACSEHLHSVIWQMRQDYGGDAPYGGEYLLRAEGHWQMPEQRTWLYGLTANEWFHLASEGDESEIRPCCGNIGELRDILRTLMQFQAQYEDGWQRSLGKQALQVVEADGEGHNLSDRDSFPLLHRVLDGIREQLAEP